MDGDDSEKLLKTDFDSCPPYLVNALGESDYGYIHKNFHLGGGGAKEPFSHSSPNPPYSSIPQPYHHPLSL